MLNRVEEKKKRELKSSSAGEEGSITPSNDTDSSEDPIVDNSIREAHLTRL